jgi:hypothetical protein
MANAVLAQTTFNGNPALVANVIRLGQNDGGTSLSAQGTGYFAQNVFVGNTTNTKALSMLYNKNDPQGPSSSFNTDSVDFVLGQNFAWTQVVGQPGQYEWVQTAGTAGQMSVQLPAADPDSIPLVCRTGTYTAPAEAGVLQVIALTTSGFTVASIGVASIDAGPPATPTYGVLASDVAGVEWILLNPKFTL